MIMVLFFAVKYFEDNSMTWTGTIEVSEVRGLP